VDTVNCTQLNLAVYLEEHLRHHPGAKYLFTGDMDDKAATPLKQNHRNNVTKHILKNEQFMDLADEDKEQGIVMHSWHEGAADDAHKGGDLADEIEICGQWKQ